MREIRVSAPDPADGDFALHNAADWITRLLGWKSQVVSERHYLDANGGSIYADRALANVDAAIRQLSAAMVALTGEHRTPTHRDGE